MATGLLNGKISIILHEIDANGKDVNRFWTRSRNTITSAHAQQKMVKNTRKCIALAKISTNIQVSTDTCIQYTQKICKTHTHTHRRKNFTQTRSTAWKLIPFVVL